MYLSIGKPFAIVDAQIGPLEAEFFEKGVTWFVD